jgi:hypothetical protein
VRWEAGVGNASEVLFRPVMLVALAISHLVAAVEGRTASVDPTVASRNVQGRSAEFRGGSTAPV